MADQSRSYPGLRPGLVGQGDRKSTILAVTLLWVGGPMLTASLVYLSLALDLTAHPALDSLGLPRVYLGTVSHRLIGGFFGIDVWPGFMTWGLLVGTLVTWTMLKLVLETFRQANWRSVLRASYMPHICLAILGLALILYGRGVGEIDGQYLTLLGKAGLIQIGVGAGAGIGLRPFAKFCFIAECLAPPEATERTSEMRSERRWIDSKKAEPISFNCRSTGFLKLCSKCLGPLCAINLAIAIFDFMSDRFVAWPVYAISIVLLIFQLKEVFVGWRLARSNIGQLTIDESGIASNNSRIAWSDIGQVWSSEKYGYAWVVLEVAPSVYDRAIKALGGPARFASRKKSQLLQRYLGTTTFAIMDTGYDVTAAEIETAIEERRPFGIQWITPVET